MRDSMALVTGEGPAPGSGREAVVLRGLWLAVMLMVLACWRA